VWLRPEATREQVLSTSEADLRQPVLGSRIGPLGDFGLNWSPRLLLDHGAAVSDPATDADVIDFQADEITAAELAIDRKVEQREVALAALQLKPNPNGPDIFRLEREFLADHSALIPGSLLGVRWRWDCGVRGCFLDPDRTAPACADEAANQFIRMPGFRLNSVDRACVRL